MELCALGEQPPLGEVPETMHAFLVRQDRFGEPKDAWQHEVIPVPALKPDEVLVYVMATGINYNNVWAALGYPIDVIRERVAAALELPGVLRVKGRFAVENRPASAVVQGVGNRVEAYFTGPGDAAQLVVIGLRDMDRTAVQSALDG